MSLQLIPREELKIDCRSTGRELETVVLHKNPPGPLSTEEMDQVFTPLINSIQEKTETAVRRTMDEERGMREDCVREQQREDLISERRAELSEKMGLVTVHSEDGSFSREWDMPYGNFIEGLRRAWEDGWEGIVEFDEEGDSLDDASDDDFLVHDEYDSFWQSYLPTMEVTVRAPYCQLVGCNKAGLLDYLSKHQMTVDQTENLLKTLKKYGLLKYDYFTEGMLDMIKFTKSRRCQMQIYQGKRRGRLCDRPCGIGKPKCSYHVYKDYKSGRFSPY